MARIAVVDDHPSARLFASACLKQDGHEVHEIEPTCLFEVLGALHGCPFDLLLVDLIMPGCPGMSLIRGCREDAHLKELKILLLTAHWDRKLARFLQHMGNIHYLQKPVAPQELCECVEDFLKGELEMDLGWSLDCQGVVAVVDDSQLSRHYHMNCLRRNGFKPLEILPENITSVLRTLEQAAPDALLLDFLMPNFRGDALIRALRASRVAALRELPILLVTAHHLQEDSGIEPKVEGVDVLFKPTLPEDLVARLQTLLKEHRDAGGATP
jgi:DNA-binding response OmpR family regulator